jgi:hypothetical protein
MHKNIRAVSLTVIVMLLAATLAATDKKPTAKESAQSPSYTIGILPFQDMSGGEYGGQLKEVLAKQLQAALLHGSTLMPRMMKVGGENAEQTDVDIPYAVKLGKFYKSDLVVMGSLLQADVEQKSGGMSGPSIGGISLSSRSSSQDATVVLQADIIDVARGEKLSSLRVTGKDHEGKISPSISTGYGSMDMGGADFQKTALGKATQNALTDLVSTLAATAQDFKPDSGAAPPNPDCQAPAGGAAASSACHILFRVMLSSSMTPLKQYTAAVAGQDLSGQVKDGVLQIGNPAAQFVMQVKVKDAPADSHVQPLYAGQEDCKCDKPEKVLVLEIDSDGSGKFNWWQ